MTEVLYGIRIAKNAPLVVGCSAVIFDEGRQKILLTRRQDNGLWCIPGGHMESGESAEEACIREVWEETGLEVEVRKLVGIYTSPDRVIQYPDGNRFQPVSLHFEVEVVGGHLRLSSETTEFGYYSLEEVNTIDFMEHLLPRIEDSFMSCEAAFIR